jgi:diguanylate cyclase (GGDEF)-like protein
MTLLQPPDAAVPRPEARGAAGETIRSLDPWARRYVTAVILAGAGAVACAIALADFRRPGGLLAFLALSTLSGAIKQPLPLKRGASSVSLSYVFDTAALLVLGPQAATLVAVSGAWSQCTFRMRNRNPAHRTLFSMAGLAVTMQVAGFVFTAARTGDGTVGGDLALPLGASALTYFLVNTMSVAVVIALSTRQNLTRVWQDNFLSSAPSYFIGAAIAAGGKLLYEQLAVYWWLVLALIPAYLTYRSYLLFILRIEDEQAEVRRASAIQLATIEALALAIEAKDRTSHVQIRKMQAYAAGLARAVRMPEEEIPGLLTATLLHDVGNLAVPEHIFSKPGPLTFEEFQKVQIHPRVGAEILKNVPFPYPVAELIAAHHEHWDGKGYPAGLAGEAIPVGARILAVVDSYASLSSDRPHRSARPHHEVMATMRQIAGSTLDPSLVETFVNLLPVLEFQFTDDAAARQVVPNIGPSHGPEGRPEATALEDIAIAHHEARALYEIAQALGASLDVTETMGLITANLNDLVPFSCSALFLRKEETGRVECRWASGVHDRAMRQLAVGSVGEIERALPMLNQTDDAEPSLRSALVSPLVVSDQVIGALAIFHTDTDAYLQDHRRVFRRVAEHASLVVHNSIVFERTQEASFTDQLTRLPNRRYMLLYLTQQMARAEQSRSKLAVVMFDLNGFKAINDALGHQAGDRALREVAAVLRSMVRSYDLCVRYGGDEFVAILWECDAEHAGQRAFEMESTVAATYFEGRGGDAFPLSASAGIAVFPEDGHTHEELIAVADRRMYQRKARQKESLTRLPVPPSTT